MATNAHTMPMTQSFELTLKFVWPQYRHHPNANDWYVAHNSLHAISLLMMDTDNDEVRDEAELLKMIAWDHYKLVNKAELDEQTRQLRSLFRKSAA